MRYRHVALIGLGLIASSISHAIRRSGADVRITGTARSAATRAEAARLGLGEIFDTAAEAAAGADLVILCVPVGAMAGVAAEIAPVLAPGATLTDVGSVKGAVVAAVAPHVPAGVHFIPGHPLAGTEHSGPGAGFAALFDNRWCLLTPPPDTDARALAALADFWTEIGARVDTMDPDHHDLVLAVTSHVPHLIAYTMVGVAEHLRAGDRAGGHQLFGRGLPRLHPHRRLRPDDVARRLPRQQGGDPRHPRPLHRGALRPPARHPHGRRRRCSTPTSPAPAPSAAASSRLARTPLPPTSAARRARAYPTRLGGRRHRPGLTRGRDLQGGGSVPNVGRETRELARCALRRTGTWAALALAAAAGLVGPAALAEERCYGVAPAGKNDGIDDRDAPGTSTVDYPGQCLDPRARRHLPDPAGAGAARRHAAPRRPRAARSRPALSRLHGQPARRSVQAASLPAA